MSTPRIPEPRVPLPAIVRPLDPGPIPSTVTRYGWAWLEEAADPSQLAIGWLYGSEAQARMADPRQTDTGRTYRARLLAVEVPISELVTLDQETGTA